MADYQVVYVDEFNDSNDTSPLAPPPCLFHWTDELTKALITLVRRDVYEDKTHPKKGKDVWSAINEEMQTLTTFPLSSAQCKKKWYNLLRTYKDVKAQIIKLEPRRRAIRFMYYVEMDEFLGEPSIKNHQAEVQLQQVVVKTERVPRIQQTPEISEDDRSLINAQDAKKKYYDTKRRNEEEKLALKRRRLEQNDEIVKLLRLLVNRQN